MAIPAGNDAVIDVASLLFHVGRCPVPSATGHWAQGLGWFQASCDPVCREDCQTLPRGMESR
jgi:hypothetical protein